jgi:hypothetical protein
MLKALPFDSATRAASPREQLDNASAC